MPIPIHPDLEAKVLGRAEAAGVNVETYFERIALDDQTAAEELEGHVLEGLNSGDPIVIRLGYWEEKHRRLDVRLNASGTR